jgi:deoxyribonuclease-4
MSPLLGAHMSIQGGLHRAIERGQAYRCTALQLFTANNLQWHGKPVTEEIAARFRAAWAASKIGPIVAHACYLIDLASVHERVRELSLLGLIGELCRAAAIGVPWVILHPGCHTGAGEEAGLRQIADLANRALDATSGIALAPMPARLGLSSSCSCSCSSSSPISPAPSDEESRTRTRTRTRTIGGLKRPAQASQAGILLETTAGQGTALGCRFEQLRWLLDAIQPPERVGVCVDTCHVFAAGYDLRTPDAYAATMAEFDRIVGLGRIHAFHVNDSKGDLGSHLDRHAHIGRGKLGLDAFRSLLRDPRFAAVPKLLETPKEDSKRKDWDRLNLATLRRLAKEEKAEEDRQNEEGQNSQGKPCRGDSRGEESLYAPYSPRSPRSGGRLPKL